MDGSLLAMFASGFLAGALVGVFLTLYPASRAIQRRDDVIDDLIWQQGEFEKVLGRGETKH